MNRGVTILFDHALGDEDRVLKVVSIPRHKGNGQILTQRQLTHIGRGAISQYVTTCNLITRLHQRTLVDTGILVRAGVLGHVVDIYTGLTRCSLIIIDTHHDTAAIDEVNHTTTLGDYRDTGVDRYITLNTGTDQWLLSSHGWNRLTLHIRPHQGAVSIIVFKERNQ